MEAKKINWSERRRMFQLGIKRKDLGYPESMKDFLSIVCEKTLGFSKTEDEISYSQIQDVFRGYSIRQLRRMRTVAVQCNLIRFKPGVGTGNLSRYTINEDQHTWLPYPQTTRLGGYKEARQKVTRYASSFNEPEKGTQTPTKEDAQTIKRGRAEAQKGTQQGPTTVFTGITVLTGKTNAEEKDCTSGDCLEASPTVDHSIINAKQKDLESTESNQSNRIDPPGVNQSNIAESEKPSIHSPCATALATGDRVDNPPGPNGEPGATMPQKRKIRFELNRVGLTDGFLEKSIGELTRDEASKAIAELVPMKSKGATA